MGMDKNKLQHVSNQPGVYLFKDKAGKIIYIGKAKSLKNRVNAYFVQPGQMDIKTGVLSKKIASFETIITETEKEALILESTLIKKHKPRYNIILKDDKRYPCLRLDISKPYPFLEIVRKIEKDGSLYFGPYASSTSVRQTLKVIHKAFKLRKCKTKTLTRNRPCLNFQMGVCLGPCCKNIDTETYQEIIHEVALFLNGKTPALIHKIKNKMMTASDNMDFEKASLLRDRMFALEKTLEKQMVVTNDFIDRDVIAVAGASDLLIITLLVIRGGILQGTCHFRFSEILSTNEEITKGFIRQYYERAPFIPGQILVPFLIDDIDLLEELLTQMKGRRVRIYNPQKGAKKHLINMAEKNAASRLQQLKDADAALNHMLSWLQKAIRMEKKPQRIECIDNSNISGSNAVAAIVVFVNGRPEKSQYRTYIIKDVKEHNDYAYMAEVLNRRFKQNDTSGSCQDLLMPDLLIVDGGKGQLNVAVSVLKELHVFGKFDIIGIAKQNDEKGETEDKIYIPKRANPLNMKTYGEPYLFLQRIRDEAHRAAISFHKKRRNKSFLGSALDAIPDIGEKRKAILLRHFKSINNIRAATIEELMAVPGMNKTAAMSVKKYLTV